MMKKLLNVLYVTTPESYLNKDGENVVVSVEGKETLHVPIHNLESIVCFGYQGASPSLMGLCAENNVGLSFLSANGYFLARVQGKVHGNVLLRKKQYRISDSEEKSLAIARNCVLGKIINSRAVIERACRDYKDDVDCDSLKKASEYLKSKTSNLSRCNSLDELMGDEGDAARMYFSVFDQLILSQKEDFYFKERSRRPPCDNMNALLSFLYTVLAHDMQSALESVGLDPYVGFLHQDRPGRPSLALDLMEELRPYLADRVALSLVNRKQINGKGFLGKVSTGITMDSDTRKEVITAWQKRKQEEIHHPFLNEKIQVGLLPYVQALLLARHIRGDLDAYPPFMMR